MKQLEIRGSLSKTVFRLAELFFGADCHLVQIKGD